MRTSSEPVNEILKKRVRRTFENAVLDLKNEEEVRSFLNDFFTKSEIETFTKRFAIAYWLKKGRSYKNIRTNLKVSSATVAAVQQMMEKPGFKLAVEKAEAEEWANQWADKIKKFVGK